MNRLRFSAFMQLSFVIICSVVPFVAQLRAANPGTDELWQQAKAALREKESAKAMALVSKVIEAEPTNATAWTMRGELHEQNRDDAGAVADYARALSLQTNAGLHQRRGWVEFRLGQF